MYNGRVQRNTSKLTGRQRLKVNRDQHGGPGKKTQMVVKKVEQYLVVVTLYSFISSKLGMWTVNNNNITCYCHTAKLSIHETMNNSE